MNKEKKVQKPREQMKIIKEKHEARDYTLQELLRAYSHWVSL